MNYLFIPALVIMLAIVALVLKQDKPRRQRADRVSRQLTSEMAAVLHSSNGWDSDPDVRIWKNRHTLPPV